VTAVISGINLLIPSQPTGLPVPACPGVLVWAASYIATTNNADGFNARGGPAHYYPAVRRLAETARSAIRLLHRRAAR
jgi:hypothetical protein